MSFHLLSILKFFFLTMSYNIVQALHFFVISFCDAIVDGMPSLKYHSVFFYFWKSW